METESKSSERPTFATTDLVSEKQNAQGSAEPSDATSELPVVAHELALKIYDTLRVEIEGFIRELGHLVSFGALATATVWSWILLNADKLGDAKGIDPVATAALLCVIPLLSALFGFRFYSIRAGIHRASCHIAKIEQAFGLNENLGWDTMCTASRTKSIASDTSFWNRNRFWANELDGWMFLFWVGIFVINCLAYAAAIKFIFAPH